MHDKYSYIPLLSYAAGRISVGVLHRPDGYVCYSKNAALLHLTGSLFYGKIQRRYFWHLPNTEKMVFFELMP